MSAKQAIEATPSSAHLTVQARLHTMTQHLAMEMMDNDIRVDAVSPAVVETPIDENFIDPEKVHDPRQGFNGLPSIGRIGKPNGVAAALDFLLPPNSAWVSGSVMNVEGGLMARRN